jgi:hypothetical protein
MRTTFSILATLLLLIFLLLGASCNKPNTSFNQSNQKTHFVDPFDYGGEVLTKDSFDIPVYRQARKASSNEMLNYLTDEASYSEQSQLEIDGKLSTGAGGFTTANAHHKYELDYGKFCNEPILSNDTDANASLLGFVRIGVGLRVVAEFTSTKDDLDVSNIISIGTNAQYLHGWMRVNVTGIQDNEITKLFPLPKDISPAAIAEVIVALSDIKKQIYTAKIIRPQVLAFTCMDKTDATFMKMYEKIARKKSIDYKRDSTISREIYGANLKLTDPSLTISDTKDLETARSKETEGFNNLRNKDFQAAYYSFIESENAYNQYRSSYEIAKLLKRKYEQNKTWTFDTSAQDEVLGIIKKRYARKGVL